MVHVGPDMLACNANGTEGGTRGRAGSWGMSLGHLGGLWGRRRPKLPHNQFFKRKFLTPFFEVRNRKANLCNSGMVCFAIKSGNIVAGWMNSMLRMGKILGAKSVTEGAFRYA